MTTDERIDAIDRIKGDCAQIEVDWLVVELRRARAALKEIEKVASRDNFIVNPAYVASNCERISRIALGWLP